MEAVQEGDNIVTEDGLTSNKIRDAALVVGFVSNNEYLLEKFTEEEERYKEEVKTSNPRIRGVGTISEKEYMIKIIRKDN